MTDHRDAGDRQPPDAGAEPRIDRRRAWLMGVGLGSLMLAALVAAFVIGTNYSDDPAPAPAVTAGAEEAPAPPKELDAKGRELFVGTCGACHTLSEAGTTGTGGPDLDALAPDQAQVEQAIAKGGTGTGAMPPGLLTGADAKRAAAYVAAAAGGG